MKEVLSTLILNVGFYFLFLAVSATVIPAFVLIMVVQAPFMSHRSAMRRFRNLIKVYGRVVMLLPYPFVKIEYRDCAASEHTPCVYICNHRSSSDPFLMAFLPGEIVQVVNKWPFRLPVLGRFARWAGYVSIREMSAEAFFERGKELLSQGVSLAVFPEGTRSMSGVMGPFHGAGFRLAMQCGVPLVPVCLTGTEKTPRKGTLKLLPSHIKIHRLDPVRPEEFQGMGAFKLKSMVHGIIAAETARMEACA